MKKNSMSVDELCARYKNAVSMVMCFIHVVTQDGEIEHDVGDVIRLAEKACSEEGMAPIFNYVPGFQHFAFEVLEHVDCLYIAEIIRVRGADTGMFFVVVDDKKIKEAVDYMRGKLDKGSLEVFDKFLVTNRGERE